eukprot:TRINITY_DN1973_c0_g2_i3.p1 TRINITY_DN1973_c0_g2~~TRINITY_DN1973_c0_g2_i3.p1  ORF type:complete len:449 (+),score=61.88 TRINITY_DN1973_c0_g2_i3:57-1403(+)
MSSSLELRIAGKYKLVKKLGAGSFGEIYLGVNIATGDEVAIKMEPRTTPHPQLLFESRLYKVFQGGVGIPVVKYYGTEGDYNAMVMDLLGSSLEDLFNYCGRKFSLKTVLMLADQMICRLEYIHSRHYIHRDIKPDNFLMGRGKRETQVYIIDFGLAKRYRDPRTSQHIPYRENKSLTGTARYAGINAHIGIEQSRRDDLESLGYVLMYFNRGSLPWQGLQAATKKQKYERISEKKISTSVETLCRGFPDEFVAYFNYVRGLKFEEKPDYAYLRKILRDAFNREGYQFDYVFDWMVIRSQRESGQAPKVEKESTPQAPLVSSSRDVIHHSSSTPAMGQTMSSEMPITSTVASTPHPRPYGDHAADPRVENLTSGVNRMSLFGRGPSDRPRDGVEESGDGAGQSSQQTRPPQSAPNPTTTSAAPKAPDAKDSKPKPSYSFNLFNRMKNY